MKWNVPGSFLEAEQESVEAPNKDRRYPKSLQIVMGVPQLGTATEEIQLSGKHNNIWQDAVWNHFIRASVILII